MSTRFLNSFLPFLLAPCLATAAEGPKITYEEHVRPIFREHCFACHNQGKATNDLALDSYERVRKGGASGEAITPGDPDGSYLFTLVTHKDQPHMPPSGDKLPADKLEILRQWIAGGALKNSGAKAEVKKPAVNLAMTAGAARPEGPPVMPEGVFRQPAVYTPRPAAITALAASPWAPLVAIAGQRQIVLYNTDSAELAGVLPFPEGIPYSLRFSRSGKLLLAGGGKAASRGLAAVYDVHSGKRLSQVGDELDAVLAADINASQTLDRPGRTAEDRAGLQRRRRLPGDRDPQAHRLGDGRGVQPRRRALGHGRSGRRRVGLGGRHRSGVPGAGGPQGGGDGDELARRLERPGHGRRRRHDHALGHGKRQADQEHRGPSRRCNVACNSCTTGGSSPAAAIARSSSGAAAATRFASSSPSANWS